MGQTADTPVAPEGADTAPAEPIAAESTAPTENEQQPAAAAEEETPDAPQGLVRITTKATLVWLDADGQETEGEECYRSLPALYKHTAKLLADNPERKDEQMEIFLVEVPLDEENAGPENQTRRVLAKGTLAEVVENLMNRVVSPEDAMKQLQTAVAILADMSGLKGVLLTAVFDEVGVSGFGLISESIALEDEDMALLGASAGSQVQQFKDTMGKQGIVFPPVPMDDGSQDKRDEKLIMTPAEAAAERGSNLSIITGQ